MKQEQSINKRARIEQRVFSGEIPIIASHLLPDSNCSVAKNTKLYNGNILPFKGLVLDYTVQAGTKSIYQYSNEGTNYWFEWGTIVDIVESPVAGDENNRIYMTGTPDGARYTDNTLAISSTPYPANDKQLGLPQPLDAPVLTPAAEPADPDPSTAETRQYVYTFVEADGSESAPSPVSAVVDPIYPGQDVSIAIVNNPGVVDLNILYARIYRTTPAGTWQFVVQVNVGVTVVNDDVATEDLGEILVTTDWVAPPTDIEGLTGLDSGAACAFKGKELFFSEPYYLYAWPIKYRLSVMFDIMALKAGSQNIYIATKGNPYIAIGTDPGEYQLIKIDQDLPCLSGRSMVDAGEIAYYASTNGIVKFDGTTAQLISSQLIHSDDWFDNYDPGNLKGVWFDNKIFYFSDTVAFIFDPEKVTIVNLDIVVTAVYNSLEENTLYILVGTSIYKWDSHATSFLEYEYKSKDFIFSPVQFNSCKVNADSYDDLTFKLFHDDVVVLTKVLTNNTPFRLPTKLKRKYSYSLTGTDSVRGVFIAQSMGELSDA